MKRSPTTSSCSSSSCVECDIIPHQSEKKRGRKNQNIQNGNSSISSGGSSRRSSIYRGVTRHRWTGRFEAHLWDKSSWNNIQNKKGRQVYLGAYDNEEAAAHTYDLAALKYWGPTTTLNFPMETYRKEMEEMQKVTKEEYLASLRRRSSGFSRGVSKYRGVARHHHNGRWEARIGRVFGNKYLYLGTYNTQEEAAAAYDMAAIEYRGANAVTNFDISHYVDRLKKKIPGFNNNNNTQSSEEEALLPTTNCSTTHESEIQVEVEQHPQQQMELLQYTQLPDSMEQISNELPWSFLDTGGFTPLTLPVPVEKPGELPDLFDHIGFEDNIDFIFEAQTQTDVILDDSASASGLSGKLEDNGQEEERLLSSTSSSSSSITTASASYIYSG